MANLPSHLQPSSKSYLAACPRFCLNAPLSRTPLWSYTLPFVLHVPLLLYTPIVRYTPPHVYTAKGVCKTTVDKTDGVFDILCKSCCLIQPPALDTPGVLRTPLCVTVSLCLIHPFVLIHPSLSYTPPFCLLPPPFV